MITAMEDEELPLPLLPEDMANITAPASLIPGFYGEISTSGLTATVEATKDNRIDFCLTDDKQ